MCNGRNLSIWLITCHIQYNEKEAEKYYKKIFRHLLDLRVFNSPEIFRKHGGISMHLQFRMEIIQKLFQK
jgi:hypothetical protein